MKFWEIKGKDPVTISPRHKPQEEFLLSHLKNIPFNSVLEIGPGDGRITKRIIENFDIDYQANDISQDRLNMIKTTLKNYRKIDYVFGPIQRAKLRASDLVIAVEVLLHIKPADIKEVIDKMIALSNGHIIIIDYWPLEIPVKLAFYNFIHDYQHIINQAFNENRIKQYVVCRINEIQVLYHLIK